MGFGPNMAAGMQRLIDAQMNFVRNAGFVYYRLRNFTDLQSQTFAQLGFQITSANGGTTDVLVAPQPAVKMISMHNIGMSMGKLRFGAREFVISASFVDAQVIAQGLNPTGLDANLVQDLVWKGPAFVGLVTNGLLFDVVSVAHEEICNKSVIWTILANANEMK
jgi:hypothetical protein